MAGQRLRTARASAPGKIILHGEHAVVHGTEAVAAALDLRTTVTATPTYLDGANSTQLHLVLADLQLDFITDLRALVETPSAAGELNDRLHVPLLFPCTNHLGQPLHSDPRVRWRTVTSFAEPDAAELHQLQALPNLDQGEQAMPHDYPHVEARLALLYLTKHILRRAQMQGIPLDLNGCRLRLEVTSRLPIGAGLGSSAALCVATAAALLLAVGHCQPEELPDHLDDINSWALVGEQVVHGNPSGLDNTISSFGRLAAPICDLSIGVVSCSSQICSLARSHGTTGKLTGGGGGGCAFIFIPSAARVTSLYTTSSSPSWRLFLAFGLAPSTKAMFSSRVVPPEHLKEKVLDPKKQPIRRLKALIDLQNSADFGTAQLRVFVKEQRAQIYTVLQQSYDKLMPELKQRTIKSRSLTETQRVNLYEYLLGALAPGTLGEDQALVLDVAPLSDVEMQVLMLETFLQKLETSGLQEAHMLETGDVEYKCALFANMFDVFRTTIAPRLYTLDQAITADRATPNFDEPLKSPGQLQEPSIRCSQAAHEVVAGILVTWFQGTSQHFLAMQQLLQTDLAFLILVQAIFGLVAGGARSASQKLDPASPILRRLNNSSFQSDSSRSSGKRNAGYKHSTSAAAVNVDLQTAVLKIYQNWLAVKIVSRAPAAPRASTFSLTSLPEVDSESGDSNNPSPCVQRRRRTSTLGTNSSDSLASSASSSGRVLPKPPTVRSGLPTRAEALAVASKTAIPGPNLASVSSPTSTTALSSTASTPTPALTPKAMSSTHPSTSQPTSAFSALSPVSEATVTGSTSSGPPRRPSCASEASSRTRKNSGAVPKLSVDGAPQEDSFGESPGLLPTTICLRRVTMNLRVLPVTVAHVFLRTIIANVGSLFRLSYHQLAARLRQAALIYLIQDGLNVFQRICLYHLRIASHKLKLFLLKVLRDVPRHLLQDQHNSTGSALLTVKRALAGPVFRTVLCAHVRISVRHRLPHDPWPQLQAQLHQFTDWEPLITEWEKIVRVLTAAISTALRQGTTADDESRVPRRHSTTSIAGYEKLAQSVNEAPRASAASPRALTRQAPALSSRSASLASDTHPNPAPESENHRPDHSQHQTVQIDATFANLALFLRGLQGVANESRDGYSATRTHATNLIRTWSQALACLGDVNAINVPRNHANVIKALLKAYKALHRTFEIADPDFRGAWIPDFARSVYDSFLLSSRFAESRYLAAKLVCDMHVITNCPQPRLGMNDLQRFYHFVSYCLRSHNRDLVHCVLRSCRHIVAFNWPGASVLYQDLILACRCVLGHGFFRPDGPTAAIFELEDALPSRFAQAVPRTACVTILTSMVHLLHAFEPSMRVAGLGTFDMQVGESSGHTMPSPDVVGWLAGDAISPPAGGEAVPGLTAGPVATAGLTSDLEAQAASLPAGLNRRSSDEYEEATHRLSDGTTLSNAPIAAVRSADSSPARSRSGSVSIAARASQSHSLRPRSRTSSIEQIAAHKLLKLVQGRRMSLSQHDLSAEATTAAQNMARSSRISASSIRPFNTVTDGNNGPHAFSSANAIGSAAAARAAVAAAAAVASAGSTHRPASAGAEAEPNDAQSFEQEDDSLPAISVKSSPNSSEAGEHLGGERILQLLSQPDLRRLGVEPEARLERLSTPEPDINLMQEVHAMLSEALRAVVLDESETTIRQLALHGIYNMLVGMLRQNSAQGDENHVAQSCLQSLLSVLRMADLQVVISAATLVGFLSELHEAVMAQLGLTMVRQLVTALLRATAYWLHMTRRGEVEFMEECLPELIEALRDWLLVAPIELAYEIQQGLILLREAAQDRVGPAVNRLHRVAVDRRAGSRMRNPALSQALSDFEASAHAMSVGSPGSAAFSGAVPYSPGATSLPMVSEHGGVVSGRNGGVAANGSFFSDVASDSEVDAWTARKLESTVDGEPEDASFDSSLMAMGVDDLADACIQPEGVGFGFGPPKRTESHMQLAEPEEHTPTHRRGRRRHRNRLRREATSGESTPPPRHSPEDRPAPDAVSANRAPELEFKREYVPLMALAALVQVQHHRDNFPCVEGATAVSWTPCVPPLPFDPKQEGANADYVEYLCVDDALIVELHAHADASHVVVRNLAGCFAWAVKNVLSPPPSPRTSQPRRSKLSLNLRVATSASSLPPIIAEELDAVPDSKHTAHDLLSTVTAPAWPPTSESAPGSPTQPDASASSSASSSPGLRPELRGSGSRCAARSHRLSINVPSLSMTVLDASLDLPIFAADDKVGTHDALDAVLTYLHGSDAAVDGDTIVTPTTDDDVRLIKDLRRQCQEGLVDAAHRSEAASSDLSSPTETNAPTRHTSSSDVPGKASAAALCSALLQHLGLWNWTQRGGLRPMSVSERLIKDLRHLDQAGAVRETHKVAVLYVGPDMQNKEDVVTCTVPSPRFLQFAEQLGWGVSVESHQGYLGKLDPSEFSGCRAHYYATATREVLFHVAPLLLPPSLPSIAVHQTWDPETRKQLYTKLWRHLGNDAVHIVWSEADTLYNTDLLPTRFGEVTIVVYPLSNGLFRIQLLFKSQMARLVGPLTDGAVVDGRSLGHLVRATAINADRILRMQTLAAPFCEARRNYLRRLVADHAQDLAFPDYVSDVLLGHSTTATTQGAETALASLQMPSPRLDSSGGGPELPSMAALSKRSQSMAPGALEAARRARQEFATSRASEA
ncbi:uncharacterized protein MONBRDRAFT_36389 [Monosiga brevicollis MX1]|uniref:Rap-GAP domain-containing protein n=1 Tax=Monosiga brevicollis TaxID=81824 RepID=A9UVB4_MONBE|nr:uncharacterized protein MONBRDRAFT_36389 [Monosiga brevicollis MX1]EDQ91053.1 predicted protein [Monosiga brevicollis MX1]|eukprot:XP_001744350.1 hypothetical protein [Monosiga brevicollis MX1]